MNSPGRRPSEGTRRRTTLRSARARTACEADTRHSKEDTMTTVRQLPKARRHAALAWVPVTDADGRTRMEMRWNVPGGQPPRRVAAAAA